MGKYDIEAEIQRMVKLKNLKKEFPTIDFEKIPYDEWDKTVNFIREARKEKEAIFADYYNSYIANYCEKKERYFKLDEDELRGYNVSWSRYDKIDEWVDRYWPVPDRPDGAVDLSSVERDVYTYVSDRESQSINEVDMFIDHLGYAGVYCMLLGSNVGRLNVLRRTRSWLIDKEERQRKDNTI